MSLFEKTPELDTRPRSRGARGRSRWWVEWRRTIAQEAFAGRGALSRRLATSLCFVAALACNREGAVDATESAQSPSLASAPTRAPSTSTLSANGPTPSGPRQPVARTREWIDGPLRFSMRAVDYPLWSGRVIDVSMDHAVAKVRPSRSPQPLDAFLSNSDAAPIAAINGGFYDIEGRPMGLVRTGGADTHSLTQGGGSGVFVYAPGAEHPYRIVHQREYRAEDSIREALQSIDRLVDDAHSLVNDAASTRRAARSAVTIDDGGRVHLVVALDERAIAEEQETSIRVGADCSATGPTLAEWSHILVEMGARSALGLDGGVSTGLLVRTRAYSYRVVSLLGTINAISIEHSGGL